MRIFHFDIICTLLYIFMNIFMTQLEAYIYYIYIYDIGKLIILLIFEIFWIKLKYSSL